MEGQLSSSSTSNARMLPYDLYCVSAMLNLTKKKKKNLTKIRSHIFFCHNESSDKDCIFFSLHHKCIDRFFMYVHYFSEHDHINDIKYNE
jgi:hypothetical protein